MLVKYYLSDNIKTPIENFALGLENAWAGPGPNYREKYSKLMSIQSVCLLAFMFLGYC